MLPMLLKTSGLLFIALGIPPKDCGFPFAPPQSARLQTASPPTETSCSDESQALWLPQTTFRFCCSHSPLIMLELSVIVCAHNPRPEYLRRVLPSLEEQTLSVELWEFILVDNASKTALADSVDLSWHPRARHVREAQLGLTAARLAGVSAAAGHVLVFVDDRQYSGFGVSFGGAADKQGMAKARRVGRADRSRI